jgi:predicted nucleic-acid-binding Zn-ribbon protein
MIISKCLKCDSAQLESGKLVGLGVHFRPNNLRFSTLKTGIPVNATMCMNCGHIEFSGDKESVKSIVKKKE